MAKKVGGGVKAAPRKRWKAYLTNEDFAAKEHLSVHYATDADAVRDAILRQRTLDRNKVADPKAVLIRVSVNRMLSKSRTNGAHDFGMKQYSVFLGGAEQAALVAIAAHHDLDGKLAAFRFALRMEAVRRGFTPKGGIW